MADTLKVVGNWKGQLFVFGELAAILAIVGDVRPVMAYALLGGTAIAGDLLTRASAAREWGGQAFWRPSLGGHMCYVAVWMWGLVTCLDAWIASNTSDYNFPAVTMLGMLFMGFVQAALRGIDGKPSL